MESKKALVHIGTSGYQYDHWRGVFYPEELPKRRWFDFYSEHFLTVEINNTFYHLPEADTFVAWRDRAPEEFIYILKYSRYGSHMKRLLDPEGHLEKFFERARLLGACLGPILLQLPPRWHVNPERLDAFLTAAPSPYRWAVEFRDPSWLCDEIYSVLRDHSAALCIHDMIPKHPEILTSDWTYLRYHGYPGSGKYPRKAIQMEAEKIAGYVNGAVEVYAYLNNDAEGYAVSNAQELTRCLEN